MRNESVVSNFTLLNFCVFNFREERLHAYKRVFEKYVLMKSIRDREKALETRSNQNKINEAGAW